MRKREKEKHVRTLWRERRTNNPNENDMFSFFCWLKKNHYEFTVWCRMNDPWQDIHTWLLKEEKKIKRENKRHSKSMDR